MSMRSTYIDRLFEHSKRGSRPMLHLLPLALAVIGLAPAADGQSSDPFASVRAAMHRMVDTVRSPSVAVAAAKDGRILFEEAIGLANQEKLIPASPTRCTPSLRSRSRLRQRDSWFWSTAARSTSTDRRMLTSAPRSSRGWLAMQTVRRCDAC